MEEAAVDWHTWMKIFDVAGVVKVGLFSRLYEYKLFRMQ